MDLLHAGYHDGNEVRCFRMLFSVLDMDFKNRLTRMSPEGSLVYISNRLLVLVRCPPG